jgi:RNA polymerase sigma factor (sigma-70 family)
LVAEATLRWMGSRFDSTCWTVVLGAARGDPSLQDEFCRRYEIVIRAYLSARWRIGAEREEIADGTQEVFLQCFRADGALERLDPTRPGGLRAFLYGVTARVASVLERKRSRWKRGSAQPGFDPDDVERSEATLSAAFDRAWAAMVGREARRLLAARAAEGREAAKRRLYCLEQRYVHGKPPREIAAALGVDAQRVSEDLRDAKNEYRAALLEVMAGFFPAATEKELEERCAELSQLL